MPGAALDEAAVFGGNGASSLASGKEEAVARAPLTVRKSLQMPLGLHVPPGQ